MEEKKERIEIWQDPFGKSYLSPDSDCFHTDATTYTLRGSGADGQVRDITVKQIQTDVSSRVYDKLMATYPHLQPDTVLVFKTLQMTDKHVVAGIQWQHRAGLLTQSPTRMCRGITRILLSWKCDDPPELFALMEKADGTLYEWTNQDGAKLSIQDKENILDHLVHNVLMDIILSSSSFINTLKIVHGDFHANNILRRTIPESEQKHVSLHHLFFATGLSTDGSATDHLFVAVPNGPWRCEITDFGRGGPFSSLLYPGKMFQRVLFTMAEFIRKLQPWSSLQNKVIDILKLLIDLGMMYWYDFLPPEVKTYGTQRERELLAYFKQFDPFGYQRVDLETEIDTMEIGLRLALSSSPLLHGWVAKDKKDLELPKGYQITEIMVDIPARTSSSTYQDILASQTKPIKTRKRKTIREGTVSKKKSSETIKLLQSSSSSSHRVSRKTVSSHSTLCCMIL